jgi:predicted TIM-barrel fold metal-dependent hydrolase
LSIDCHIHVFRRNSAQAPDARHNPDYDASLDNVRALAKPAGITRFVLIQTSFMGTDNTLLAAELEQNPADLRGVFILDPKTSRAELRDLRQSGVVGIRLNLFQTELAETLAPEQLGLIERCSHEGLSVSLHDDAARLLDILQRIDGRANKLVIDHFGRPESLPDAESDPIYDALLGQMADLGAYVKISAPYRAKNMNSQAAYVRLRQVLGPSKLLWGSDWPWTQHRDAITYGAWVRPFNGEDLAATLQDNAAAFYSFR